MRHNMHDVTLGASCATGHVPCGSRLQGPAPARAARSTCERLLRVAVAAHPVAPANDPRPASLGDLPPVALAVPKLGFNPRAPRGALLLLHDASGPPHPLRSRPLPVWAGPYLDNPDRDRSPESGSTVRAVPHVNPTLPSTGTLAHVEPATSARTPPRLAVRPASRLGTMLRRPPGRRRCRCRRRQLPLFQPVALLR